MIELQQLRTFCAVVENKSFTKAGKLVGRTQSTISGQISAVESVYGTALLDRSGRKIVITEGGKILYNYAKRILRLVDESKDKIDELKHVVSGNLIIGASTIPGTYILPDNLSGFKQQYPNVNISVRISNSRDVITKILEHKLEVGAVGEKIDAERLEYIDLAKDRIVLVVHPHHPWAKKKNIALDELKIGEFIWREEGSGTRDTVERAMKNKGIKGLKVVMELGSTQAVKEGVKAGLGVSFISEWAIKDSSLHKVKVRNLDVLRHFYIVFLRIGVKSRATQAFIDFVSSSRRG